MVRSGSIIALVAAISSNDLQRNAHWVAMLASLVEWKFAVTCARGGHDHLFGKVCFNLIIIASGSRKFMIPFRKHKLLYGPDCFTNHSCGLSR